MKRIAIILIIAVLSLTIALPSVVSGASDPEITWNTFLGGEGDEGYDIAVDSSGNVYVTGYSDGTWGTPERDYTDSSDAFVAKLDSSGELLWNTFLGGEAYDGGENIAVDSSGNVYVTGRSQAAWGDDPVLDYTPGSPYPGADDAFVAKLDSSGELTWHTFLGGDSTDIGYSIAVDDSGDVYVTGYSYSTWGADPALDYTDSGDAFVAKLDSSGNFTWNTFLGSDKSDEGYSIAVGDSGDVYVTGFSNGTWGDDPVLDYTPGYYGTEADAFVASINSSSGELIWNTFLGGGGYDGDDLGQAIAVDSSGSVYVTGRGMSNWGDPVMSFSGYTDAFVAKLDSSGNLTWNTFLGSNEADYGFGIAVDGSGNVYVTGISRATWGDPVWDYTEGAYDILVAGLNSDNGNLSWNAFLGSSSSDGGDDIAVDGSGNVYITGYSNSTWGEPVQDHTGIFGSNAFVAKIGYPEPVDSTAPTAAITYSAAGPYKEGDSVTITATFSEAMADSPVVQIAISGAETLAATDMTKTDSTQYTYVYIVGSGDGTASVSLSTGKDLAGNPITSTPASEATFTVDNTAPTVAISYSPDGPYEEGDSVTITATFSEAMSDSSMVQIAISGGQTLAATDMTKTDSTHYTYVYTVGSGDGTATVSLSNSTDLAGNPITSAPTSEATFTVDNTDDSSSSLWIVLVAVLGGLAVVALVVTIIMRRRSAKA